MGMREDLTLPDITEIKLERLENGLYSFRYLEKFKKLKGMDKKKISATAYFLRSMLPEVNVKTGEDWIEMTAKGPREMVFNFLVGEYLPYSGLGNIPLGELFLMAGVGQVPEEVGEEMMRIAGVKKPDDEKETDARKKI